MTQLATTQPPQQQLARGNGDTGTMRRLASDSGTLKNLLEAQKDKLATVLPRHLTPDRLMRVVLVAVSKSELLQKCTVGSILQCVMTSAQLGLDCSGVLGSAYMVPFFNKNIGAYEATLIPGYRGLIDLARRSGEIEDVTAHCVYRDDEFRLELGADPKLIHVPNLEVERLDDNIVGSYMVAFLKGNSRPHVEFVPRSDIEKVRRASRAGQKGPWVDWFAEMCRKTAIRRGIKYLPMSVELAEAFSLDDKLSSLDDTRVISAETGASRTDSLLKKITSRPVDERQTFGPPPGAIAEVAYTNDSTDGSESPGAPVSPAPSTPLQADANQDGATHAVPAAPATSEPEPVGPAMSDEEKSQVQFTEWVEACDAAAAEWPIPRAEVAKQINALLAAKGLRETPWKLSAEFRTRTLADISNRTGLFAVAKRRGA